jgi:hypothetical protein
MQLVNSGLDILFDEGLVGNVLLGLDYFLKGVVLLGLDYLMSDEVLNMLVMQ